MLLNKLFLLLFAQIIDNHTFVDFLKSKCLTLTKVHQLVIHVHVVVRKHVILCKQSSIAFKQQAAT